MWEFFFVVSFLMWAKTPCWFSNLPQSWGYFSKERRAGKRVRWDGEQKKIIIIRHFFRIKMGEVWRFGGFPYSFWGHLSKNPNYFLFLLLPSNPLSPGLTPHHNICFLSPLSQSPLTVSHLYPSDSNPLILKAHSCASSTSTTLINSTSKQQQQLLQMCQSAWHVGGTWTGSLT